MLFSATQDAKVVDIAKLCFKKTRPVYVGVDDKRDVATVDTLEQVFFRLFLFICFPTFYFILFYFIVPILISYVCLGIHCLPE